MNTWDLERGRVGKVQALKEKLDALKVEIEHAERGYDLNKAAELTYAVMPKLQASYNKKPDSVSRNRPVPFRPDQLKRPPTDRRLRNRAKHEELLLWAFSCSVSIFLMWSEKQPLYAV